MAAEAKGEDLMRQADKKLQSWSFFNKAAKFEEAAELFARAAAQFKIAKVFDKAGKAFESAAENSERAGNDMEATKYYTDAGRVYKMDDARDAVRMYKVVVAKLQEANKFSQAAKILKQIAEIWEDEMKVDEAIEAYEKAAEYYEMENSSTTANAMHLKVADFCAEKGEYGKAIGIYQKVAAASLDSALTKWSVTDYYFRALLCSFAQESASQNECKSTREAHENYCDAHPPFAGSREGKLVADLLDQFDAGDVTAFTDSLFAFNQISQLDNFKSGLLLKVKRRMIEADNDVLGGDGAAAAGAAAEDDDELDVLR